MTKKCQLSKTLAEQWVLLRSVFFYCILGSKFVGLSSSTLSPLEYLKKKKKGPVFKAVELIPKAGGQSPGM